MSKDLTTAMDELKGSVDRLSKRFSSWWKIVWYGMLQGAGAVLGATAVILLIGWLLNIVGVIPFLSESANELKTLFNSRI